MLQQEQDNDLFARLPFLHHVGHLGQYPLSDSPSPRRCLAPGGEVLLRKALLEQFEDSLILFLVYDTSQHHIQRRLAFIVPLIPLAPLSSRRRTVSG